MKITPKYNIGDLLVYKIGISQYEKESDENLRPIIGWITDVKTYHQNNLIAYSVQWSDKDDSILISEEEVNRLRQNYEKLRNS